MEEIDYDSLVEEAEERLRNIRRYLTLYLPFFGALSASMPTKPMKGLGTAATNGTDFIYDPLFVCKSGGLSTGNLAFLYIHEISHVALDHIYRRGDKNPKLWNYACDYAINYMIHTMSKPASFNSDFIEGGLFDAKYKGLDAEQIYKLLEEEQQNQPKQSVQSTQSNQGGSGKSLDLFGDNQDQKQDQGNNQESGQDQDDTQDKNSNRTSKGCGCSEDKPQGSHKFWDEVDPNDTAKHMETMTKVKNAAESSKSSGVGGVPQEVLGVLSEFYDAKQNWRQILNSFVEPLEVDYNYNPP